MAAVADVHIAPDTGPEVITCSTRMRAGTAQNLVLNAFSTASMVRLGRTYSNLMTDMLACNDALRARQLRILAEATGADPRQCREALRAGAGDAKVAVVTLIAGADVERARRALTETRGRVHLALRLLDGSDPHSPDLGGSNRDGSNRDGSNRDGSNRDGSDLDRPDLDRPDPRDPDLDRPDPPGPDLRPHLDAVRLRRPDLHSR